jgi:hypothetical protein
LSEYKEESNLASMPSIGGRLSLNSGPVVMIETGQPK